MGVYFYKARDRWCFDFQHAGRRYNGYALEPDGSPCRIKASAGRAERRKRARAEAGKVVAPPQGSYSVAEAIADWAENVGQHRRSWKRNIRAYLRELKAWFGPSRPIDEIDADLIDRYVAWSRECGKRVYLGGAQEGGKSRPAIGRRSDSTINRYLACLRAVLRRAEERNRIPGWRAPRVLYLDEPEDLPSPIPDEALRAILAAAALHLRDVLIIVLHTGMRLRECLYLTWDNIHLAERVILLESRRTKARRGRSIYINELAFQTLRRLADQAPEGHVASNGRVILYYPEARKNEPASPPRPVDNVYTAWRSALKRAGYDGRWRFHDTRASFASALHALGAGVRDLQDATGHASIKTTMRYIRSSDDRYRALMERLSGRAATADFFATESAEREGVGLDEGADLLILNRSEGGT